MPAGRSGSGTLPPSSIAYKLRRPLKLLRKYSRPSTCLGQRNRRVVRSDSIRAMISSLRQRMFHGENLSPFSSITGESGWRKENSKRGKPTPAARMANPLPLRFGQIENHRADQDQRNPENPQGIERFAP